MSSKSGFLELPGLWVTVDRVEHQPQVVTPPDRPHCFVYYITIHNESDLLVTIKGRKWVVTNARGERMVLEGDGVVGQVPEIPAGQNFSYNSFHLIETPSAAAEGSYFGLDEHGRKVVVRIPRFKMSVP